MPMVVIAGTVDVDPEQRDQALEEGRPLIEGALTQEGCLAYVWSKDPFDPGRIHVYERWADQDALSAHFQREWYVQMRDTIGSHGLRDAKVLKYLVQRSEPVYDSQGVPRADFTS